MQRISVLVNLCDSTYKAKADTISLWKVMWHIVIEIIILGFLYILKCITWQKLQAHYSILSNRQ